MSSESGCVQVNKTTVIWGPNDIALLLD